MLALLPFVGFAPTLDSFGFLRAELPGILAKRTDVLSLRMLHIIEGRRQYSTPRR